MKRPSPPRAAALSAVLLCAACSSSDSSGGTGGGGQTTAAITTANATEVAGSMALTMELVDMQETTDFTAYATETTDCSDGGSITAGFQIDEAPVGQVSTGDRYAITIASCAIGILDMNGSIVVDFNTVDGNPDTDATWEIDIDLTLDDLVLTAGGSTVSLDGAWSQNASVDGLDSEYTLTGSFTSEANDGNTVQSASLAGFELTCDYDSTADEATYTAQGRFSSTDLGGSVTVSTLTAFTVVGSDDYPSSGAIQVSGANDSLLVLTAVDSTFAQLQVDADGDGDFEFQDVVEWDDLE